MRIIMTCNVGSRVGLKFSALFLLFIPAIVHAELVLDGTINHTYTDNIFTSIEAPVYKVPVKEKSWIGNGGLGYVKKYGERHYLYAMYRAGLIHHEKQKQIRSVNNTLSLQLNNNLSKISTLNVNLQTSHHNYHKEKLYTYWISSASLFFKQHLIGNFVFESNYGLTLEDFVKVEYPNGSDFRVNTFNLIDNAVHAFRIKLKHWPSSFLRWSITQNSSLTIYEKTGSGVLQLQSGISPLKARQDALNAPRLDVTLLPVENLVLNIGYLLKHNNSNYSHYRYLSNSLVSDILFVLMDDHEIFASLEFGLYHYFDRKFAPLYYDNTKKDFRTVFSGSYTYQILHWVALAIQYKLNSNDSNDTQDLKADNKSYTTFDRNEISTKLKFSF